MQELKFISNKNNNNHNLLTIITAESKITKYLGKFNAIFKVAF